MLPIILIAASIFIINIINFNDDDIIQSASTILLSIIVVLLSITCVVGDSTVSLIMNKYEEGKIKKSIQL
jgi:hypothetical protein